MEALSADFDVHGLDLRGHGASELPTPDQPDDPWVWYVKDLEHLIERHFDGQALYAGHSLAAVSAIRLASKRPELFWTLIAIDPAILPRGLAAIYPFVRRFEPLAQRSQLYKGALNRRDHWSSREEALGYFTGRKAFASWPDTAVVAYVDSCLRPGEGGGLTLACPKTWEARTFKYVPHEVAGRLRRLSCQTLILKASRGSIWNPHLRLSPSTQMREVEGSHFVHLETPQLIADQIREAAGFD